MREEGYGSGTILLSFLLGGVVGLILDCLHRTEHAMPQRHTFLAIELALAAQVQALRLST